MPVAPEIGTAFALQSLQPFHSFVLCEAVIITEPSAFSVPFRGRGEADVEDFHALVDEAPGERREERIRRLAAVARDDDLAALHARELHVGARNLVEVGLGEILAVDAADVIRFEDAHGFFLLLLCWCRGLSQMSIDADSLS